MNDFEYAEMRATIELMNIDDLLKVDSIKALNWLYYVKTSQSNGYRKEIKKELGFTDHRARKVIEILKKVGA